MLSEGDRTFPRTARVGSLRLERGLGGEPEMVSLPSPFSLFLPF